MQTLTTESNYDKNSKPKLLTLSDIKNKSGICLDVLELMVVARNPKQQFFL